MRKSKIAIGLLAGLMLIKLLPSIESKYQDKKTRLEEDLRTIENYSFLKYGKKASLEDISLSLEDKLRASNYQKFLGGLYQLEDENFKVLDIRQLSKEHREEAGLSISQRKLDLNFKVLDSQSLLYLSSYFKKFDSLEVLDLAYRKDLDGNSLSIKIEIDEYNSYKVEDENE